MVHLLHFFEARQLSGVLGHPEACAGRRGPIIMLETALEWGRKVN